MDCLRGGTRERGELQVSQQDDNTNLEIEDMKMN